MHTRVTGISSAFSSFSNKGDNTCDLCRDDCDIGSCCKSWSFCQTSAWAQIRATLVILTGALSVGMNFGFSAATLPQLRPDHGIRASFDDSAWIASMVLLLAPLGSIVSIIPTDRMGRRRSLQTGCVICLVGWIIVASAADAATLCIGRVVQGFASGWILIAVQAYLTEIAQQHLRNKLIASISVAIFAGVFLIYGIGSAVHWRHLAQLSALVPCSCTILLNFVADSPLWLAYRGKREEAAKALKRIRGDTIDTKEELFRILQRTREKKPRLFSRKLLAEFLTAKVLAQPTKILIPLLVAQAYSGTYQVIFYAYDVFNTISPRPAMSYSGAAILFAFTHALVSGFAPMLLHRIGLRLLMVISGVGMTVSLLMVSSYNFHTRNYFTVSDNSNNMPSNSSDSDNVTIATTNKPAEIKKEMDGPGGYWLPVVALWLHAAFYSIGFGQAPWAVVREMFPARLRGLAEGCLKFTVYLLLFTSVQAHPYLIRDIKVYGTFWTYSIIVLGATILLFFLLRGVTFENDDEKEESDGPPPVLQRSNSNHSLSGATNKIAPLSAIKEKQPMSVWVTDNQDVMLSPRETTPAPKRSARSAKSLPSVHLQEHHEDVPVTPDIS